MAKRQQLNPEHVREVRQRGGQNVPLAAHEIGGEDLRALTEVLLAEGLPTEDLHHAGRRFFAFRDGSGSTVGYGGLEEAGADALLRSVMTVPMARRAGYGRAITEWLVREATRTGARDLYLLTTTARDFFAKLGFEVIDRASVPAAVAASCEFSSLCPSTAVVMIKRLAMP